MKILAIKTADNEAELVLLENNKIISKRVLDLGRELAKELPRAIENLLKDNDVPKVDGYIGFLGPGSFTGLRIGISAINALAYAYNLPIVGANGDKWINDGVDKLVSGANDKVIIPNYGAEPNITQPRK